MERVVVVNWTVLCVYILLLGVISAVHHDSHQHSLVNRESGGNGETKTSSLTFGPKLGRRKRNSGNDVYENLQKEGLAVLLMSGSPWTDVLTSSDGKRHVVSFTPRLGRESGEEIILGPEENRWLQDSAMSEEALYQRSPPFAPRLGRHSPFYPRLGRDTDKMAFS